MGNGVSISAETSTEQERRFFLQQSECPVDCSDLEDLETAKRVVKEFRDIARRKIQQDGSLKDPVQGTSLRQNMLEEETQLLLTEFQAIKRAITLHASALAVAKGNKQRHKQQSLFYRGESEDFVRRTRKNEPELPPMWYRRVDPKTAMEYYVHFEKGVACHTVVEVNQLESDWKSEGLEEDKKTAAIMDNARAQVLATLKTEEFDKSIRYHLRCEEYLLELYSERRLTLQNKLSRQGSLALHQYESMYNQLDVVQILELDNLARLPTEQTAPGLSSLSQPIQGNRTDILSLQTLLTMAERIQPFFTKKVCSWASEVSVDVLKPAVKGIERAAQKAMEDYFGDYSAVRDLLRASIVFESLTGLLTCLKRVKADEDVTLVRIKNRFSRSFDALKCGGYRDILLNLAIGTADSSDKFIVELQLHLSSFIDLKSSAHQLYEVLREIDAYAESNAVQTLYSTQGQDLKKLEQGGPVGANFVSDPFFKGRSFGEAIFGAKSVSMLYSVSFDSCNAKQDELLTALKIANESPKENTFRDISFTNCHVENL